jgi:hypothetical protein
MTSTISPLVLAILALKSELPSIPDELRKRVQSIRVRSAQESQGPAQGWRQKSTSGSKLQQNSFTNNGRYTNHTQNSAHTSQSKPNLGGHWRNSASSLNSGSASPAINSATPFRFLNSTATSPSPVSPSVSSPKPQTLNVSQIPQTPQTPPTPSTPHTPLTNTRYTSRFHNGAKKGDDQILNTIILNKLNLFSIKTYDDVKQFLFQILGSDQKEFVREFTWLVFRKAAAESKFCGLFAKLLSEIKKEYPVILEEMRKLHTTYLDIWNIKDTEDTKVDRRCRLGYSQFLAELTALEVLESDTMKATLETLKACIVECLSSEEYKETIEEYMDCLKQLCGSKVPKPVRVMIKDILVEDMEDWIEKGNMVLPGLSQKSRFACMDLRDLLCK